MKRSLTKPEILRRRAEISRLFGGKVVYRTKGLHLRIIENDLGWSRVLFTAPRAFHGAVARNRARRQVREVYRHIKFRLIGHFDMAFIMYPGGYSYSDRSKQVETLLQRARVISPG